MLIKINNDNNNENEWCILELQGEVIGELDNNSLGTIPINSNGTAVMNIGIYYINIFKKILISYEYRTINIRR